MKAVILAAALITLPAAASAYCAGPSGGSALQSCEDGVRVIRQQPMAMPSIHPRDTAALELKRDTLALQRQRQNAQISLERRRLDQRDRELRLRSYLYQDARSPLRTRSRRLGYAYGPFVGARGGFIRH